MASVQVCKYFKFGHCRFLDKCRHQHVTEVCDDISCDSILCHKRHPKSCIFYREYKRCKFGSYCSYKQDNENIVNKEHNQLCQLEITTLSSKIKSLEEWIKDLVKENTNLKLKIEAIELELQAKVKISDKESFDLADNENAKEIVFNANNDDSIDNFLDYEEAKAMARLKNSSGRELLGGALASFPSWSCETP